MLYTSPLLFHKSMRIPTALYKSCVTPRPIQQLTSINISFNFYANEWYAVRQFAAPHVWRSLLSL